MKVFDFNVHLPCKLGDTNEKLADESRMGPRELQECFSLIAPQMQDHADSANFMLFNEDLFYQKENLSAFVNLTQNKFPGSTYTALLDFRRNNYHEAIDAAKSTGVRGVKFHSYVQKIADADIQSAVRAAQYAQQKRLFICIDASFGTSKMYVHDNMKLACAVSEVVSEVPIIILHSGGARVLEAMLLAEDKQNIWFETSFTLPYYWGSSIEQDLAFAYKKIGTRRILYASDYPYINFAEAKDKAMQFFEKYRFSSADIDNMMWNNAINLLQLVNHE